MLDALFGEVWEVLIYVIMEISSAVAEVGVLAAVKRLLGAVTSP